MQNWRSFQFFDSEVVKEERDGGKGQPVNALEKLEVTCCTSGLGKLIFGDHEGYVHLFDRALATQSFQAYGSQVTHMKQLRKRNLLFTVGDEAGADAVGRANVGVVKVWEASRHDAQLSPLRTQPLFGTGGRSQIQMPEPMRLQLNLNPDKDLELRGNATGEGAAAAAGGAEDDKQTMRQNAIVSPIRCIDVTEDQDFFACGLTDGAVVLAKGEFSKPASKIQIRRLVRPKKMGGKEPDADYPVSWLGFKKLQAGRDADPLRRTELSATPKLQQDVQLLYVLYPDGAVLWVCPSKGGDPTPIAMNCEGCDIGCACMFEDYPQKGEWRLVVAKGDRLDFFGIDQDPAANAHSSNLGSIAKKIGTFRSYLWVVARMSDGQDQLTIYDLGNKLRALSRTQDTPHCIVRNLVCAVAEWGSIYILCQDDAENRYVSQKLIQFEERDTQTKLELLYRKQLYSVAIALAQSAQDFERHAVMEIYKKYGDWYLQKPDYRQAVEQYIKTIGSLEPSYVIRKFLDAQRIQDLTRYLEALHNEKVANEDHTTLLLNCYTKLKNQEKLDEFIGVDEAGAMGSEQPGRKFDVETAIKVCRQAGYYRHAVHLAWKYKQHTWYLLITIEDLQKYREGLDYIRRLDHEAAEAQLQIYGKALVSHLPEETTTLLMEICTEWKHRGPGQEEGEPCASDPDEFLPCFVDAPYYLMQFLESVVKNKQHDLAGSRSPGTAMVFNTLLELYLTKDLKRSIASGSQGAAEAGAAEADADGDGYEERKRKALTLLREYGDQGKYDREHALVLVQTHNFRDGILYLYEKLDLYQDILQYHMRQNDYDEVIATCERFGEKDHNMWVQVLLFFVQMHETQDVTIELQKVLELIDRGGHLPPLVVIDILSKNSRTKLETIKEYVIARLRSEMEQIQADQDRIKEYQIATHKMRNEIRDLQCNAQIFQLTKCTHCMAALDLPAVHFMCKHSYHKRCLGEREDECPQCASEFAQVMERKRQMDEKVECHDEFFALLREGGGFPVVADYFGRSIFNGEYPQPEDDAAVMSIPLEGLTVL
eukprot:TRINITY_DN25649_c0_g1_i1.p1 TRINITY_DN25649_c0_g1~~TRINITY_DN25649_c0_g1_i1.p1  ORF type:complete len:1048 (+),score=476.22 TRINITY_DN25649_c0_g1_i1:93-3236(+)